MKEIDNPFKSTFSLDYLIEFWKKDPSIPEEFRKIVLEKLKKHPELHGNIDDVKLIEMNKSFVETLLSVALPNVAQHRNFFAISKPFEEDIFYSTPIFREYFLDNGKEIFSSVVSDLEILEHGRLLGAYTLILRAFYDINVHLEFPVILNYKNPKTGLNRYYKLRVFPEFCQILHHGELRPFTQEEMNDVLDNLSNLEMLSKLIPIQDFEVRGFVMFDAVDITDETILSTMKNEMFKPKDQKEHLTDLEGLLEFQGMIRDLLKLHEIELGGVMLMKDGDITQAAPHGRSFVLNEVTELTEEQIKNSLYNRVLTKRKSDQPKTSVFELVLGDYSIEIVNEICVENCSGCIVQKTLYDQGVRNLLLIPIVNEDEVMGILEIASKTPRQLNEINAIKLEGVVQLLSESMKGKKAEFQKEIQAVIKENCTAIHPTVEWRFEEEAQTYLMSKSTNPEVKMKEVVFDHVYPLYAVSDIRHSSDIRNKAIQDDLIEQLSLANQILSAAYKIEELPYIDELKFRIKNYTKKIKAELTTRDEVDTLTFLKNDVESLFSHLSNLSDDTSMKVNHYQTLTDNEFGIVYKERAKYATSVNQINALISSHLNEAQKKAQNMFPHYFELYKTDGVEHEIYVGDSLVKDNSFCPLYIKNLRLWQLMTMCEVVQKSNELTPTMELQLETAHLILVQDIPLTIRFRMDEKRFDVDGAYNIRYEMVKKRIDKAEIQKTSERLTQPGMIAIVYNQPKEYDEYLGYIEYLQHAGLVEGEIEHHDLKQMQGVSGLKAIRFKVATSIQKNISKSG